MNNNGSWLRTARKFRGLSQADLSRASGVHPSTISRFETGLCCPSPEQAETLARILRVNVGFILQPECPAQEQEACYVAF
jgi:transcriptional regulator with XRE-family HTH domain